MKNEVDQYKELYSKSEEKRSQLHQKIGDLSAKLESYTKSHFEKQSEILKENESLKKRLAKMNVVKPKVDTFKKCLQILKDINEKQRLEFEAEKSALLLQIDKLKSTNNFDQVFDFSLKEAEASEVDLVEDLRQEIKQKDAQIDRL